MLHWPQWLYWMHGPHRMHGSHWIHVLHPYGSINRESKPYAQKTQNTTFVLVKTQQLVSIYPKTQKPLVRNNFNWSLFSVQVGFIHSNIIFIPTFIMSI